MVEFSLALNDDQIELRDWVHGFAADVVRPAASEWDAREETPWPVIREAAKNGLYGFEFLAQCWSDPTGISINLANEELFWGDAGIGMSIFGTTLAVAAIYGSGTPDQMVEWLPQCYGDADDPKLAAFATTEPQAGSDVGAMRTRARVGPERAEGRHHQRRHRERPRRHGGRRARARFARAGGVRRPARDQGPAGWQEAAQARAARLTHG